MATAIIGALAVTSYVAVRILPFSFFGFDSVLAFILLGAFFIPAAIFPFGSVIGVILEIILIYVAACALHYVYRIFKD